jgi:hypothetical protein
MVAQDAPMPGARGHHTAPQGIVGRVRDIEVLRRHKAGETLASTGRTSGSRESAVGRSRRRLGPHADYKCPVAPASTRDHGSLG